MPMSTKCQKNDNVIQHDDRLWYLRPFYNGAFSITSKNDIDDQNLLLATVLKATRRKKFKNAQNWPK
jgi:hypothetical protein